VSKLQTALQKLSNRKDGSPADVADRANDADQLVSRYRSRETTIRPKTEIRVNRRKLIDAGVAIEEEFEHELRDEMRRIKWPVLNNAFGEQSQDVPRGNVVMVSSATSGEGKTFTTINLALSIAAEKDYDVLLVDADIAKPHASESFGIMDHAGVIDYLLGDVDDVTDIIVGTDIPGLRLLSAGKPHEHSSELIASARMQSLVDELTTRFPSTVILFDTSPVLLTNESQVLSRIVGQILLVVAANRTSQVAAREAANILGSDRVLNVIFNRVNSVFRQKYRYGGYYGYTDPR